MENTPRVRDRETRDVQGSQKKLKVGKKDRRRVSMEEIYQYTLDGQHYLVPHSYNATTYCVRAGNPILNGGKKIYHNIRFWRGKFSFNDGKVVWKLDDPRSASFLESLKKFKLPDVLKTDEEDVLHVVQIIREGDKGLSEKKRCMERKQAKLSLFEDSKEHMSDDDGIIDSGDDILTEQTSSTTQNTSVPEECEEECEECDAKDFLSSSDWDSDEYD